MEIQLNTKYKQAKFNNAWENALFHICMIKKMKNIDLKNVLIDLMKNNGKMNDKIMVDLMLSEDKELEYEKEKQELYEERVAIMEADGKLTPFQAKVYAFVDIFFTPEEKEEIKQIKQNMRQCYGL